MVLYAISCQTQETPKPEKPERKKEKFVNLLSHGDIILKGSYNKFM